MVDLEPWEAAWYERVHFNSLPISFTDMLDREVAEVQKNPFAPFPRNRAELELAAQEARAMFNGGAGI